jgi:hypothetical protein
MNYIDPYRSLSENESKQLWNAISEAISPAPEASRFSLNYKPSPLQIKKTHKTFFRDYSIAALCVLLISSGGSAAAAAENSLPNSVLYPIKIHITEPIQSLTKTTPESKITWEIERTKRRMQETQALLSTGKLTSELANDLAEKISDHTEEAQSELSLLGAHDSEQSVALSANLIDTIEQEQDNIVAILETQGLPTPSGTPELTSSSTILPTTPEQLDTSSGLSSIISAAETAQSAITEQTRTLIAAIPSTEQITTDGTQSNSISEGTTISVIEPLSVEIVQYALIMQDINNLLLELSVTRPDPETKAVTVPEVAGSTISAPESASKDTSKEQKEAENVITTETPTSTTASEKPPTESVIVIETPQETKQQTLIESYQESFVRMQQYAKNPTTEQLEAARLLRKTITKELDEVKKLKDPITEKSTSKNLIENAVDNIITKKDSSQTLIPSSTIDLPMVSEERVLVTPLPLAEAVSTPKKNQETEIKP